MQKDSYGFNKMAVTLFSVVVIFFYSLSSAWQLH